MTSSTVRGTCHHDCPDSCGWVATVEDGVAVKLRGNPAHPFSRGELCPKVNRFLQRVYSPERILHPLVRTGAKGSGEFRQAAWDEALAVTADRLHGSLDRHGGEAVLGWFSAGNQSVLAMGGLSARFLDRLGASRQSGSLCGAIVSAGTSRTYGDGRGMDPTDLRHSRFIVLWGTNTRMTNRHLWHFVEEARAGGAVVVVVDPLRTLTAESADWFVQPMPGTDMALALAMMHVLGRDDLVDHDYVERYTTGFDELRAYVAAWTPARAGRECGLDPAEIERLAHAYGTTRPAAIRVLVGAEHRAHGGALFQTLACLPLLVGAWRDRGGGYARSVGIWSETAVDDSVLGPSPSSAGGRPPRQLNMSRLGQSLTDPTLHPPVDVLLVWNGNPLVSVPNAELVRRGLAREDLFCVVHEQFLTDTARYADVVLPATTQLEQRDVVTSWGHLYVGWNEPAIAPLGEAVPNTELFRRLAAAMGFTEPELFTGDDDLLDAALHRIPPADRDLLESDGFLRLPLPEDLRPYSEGGFATPDGRAQLGLPAYRWAAEGIGGDADLAARFPLVLLTTKSHTRFLNTSYSHLPGHGSAEGPPTLLINAADAAGRDVADGVVVRVWNDRGEVRLPAQLSDVVRPGVVAMPFGWWRAQHTSGTSANALTSDGIADVAGGSTFHDTLVEVATLR